MATEKLNKFLWAHWNFFSSVDHVSLKIIHFSGQEVLRPCYFKNNQKYRMRPCETKLLLTWELFRLQPKTIGNSRSESKVPLRSIPFGGNHLRKKKYMNMSFQTYDHVNISRSSPGLECSTLREAALVT